MAKEYTQADIDKMNAELDELILVLMPEILEEVKFTKSFGDLSENAEYHEAKAIFRKRRSRIRYLKNELKNAIIISDKSAPDEIGLNDKVTFSANGNEMSVYIVTSFGHDSLNGVISKESPIGKAFLGHKVGDEVTVKINDEFSYVAEIKALEKGAALTRDNI